MSMWTSVGQRREMQSEVEGAQRGEKRHLMPHRGKTEEDKGKRKNKKE